MISPRFATMLCFVQTDAALAPETAELLLGVCVKRSFDRASVDGQLSTNDTAILMCSGASGVSVEPESEDELRFGEALDALLRALAVMMVADGEGAGRIAPRGRPRRRARGRVEAAARAVANSPLVKAALHGGDPNWGRIVQAVGGALPGREPARAAGARRRDRGHRRCARAAPRSPTTRPRSRGRRSARRSSTRSRLPGEGAETEVFFSDLSHEYVTSTPTTRHEPHADCEASEHDPACRTPPPASSRSSRCRPRRREVRCATSERCSRRCPTSGSSTASTVVIKYGGAAMEDEALREEFARDVVLLKYVGLNPIVVHGGGPEITGYMERLGLPVEFVGGLRVSDESTVEVAKMVLVGKVNKEIVLRLNRHGQPAVGLCGDDGSLFRVARRTAPGRRGHRLRRAASSASTSA